MTTVATTETGTTTTASRRTTREKVGVGLTALVTVFLAFDSVSHLLNVDAVREANEKFGAPDWFPQLCGAVLAVCLVTYLSSRTAVLGAVLLTGYLGGAVCANLLTDQPAFNSVFAIFTGVLVWAGLGARDQRVRVLYTR